MSVRSDENHLECVPSPVGLSPPGNGKYRGGFQPPHTAQEAGRISREFQRTATFRLEPDTTQYALLRLRDAQAAQRMNRYSVQLFAERNGWRPPDGSAKDSLTKHGRLQRDDLSSAIYVACEKRVRNDWQRIGKRIWSGTQIPTYRKGCLPFDSGGRPDKGTSCGVEIIRTADAGFAARLHTTADYADGPNWIEVRLGRKTERDDRRAQLAAEFADGQRHVLNGCVRFAGNKVLLTVAFKVRREIPPVGRRVATLSELDDGRLILRTEFASLDFSSRLHALKVKKEHRDGIQRRFSRRSMRSKGSARRLSRKLAQVGFADWCKTAMHQWSAEMVRWAGAQECGTFVAILTGGDWAAHDLIGKLKYKCEEAGLTFATEASMEDVSTDRAVQSSVKKKQRKAKKLGDALREVNHQLGDRHA